MSTISTLRRRQQTPTPWEELLSVDLGRQIRKCSELDLSRLERFPRYGPAFANGEHQFYTGAKEKAWRHVIEKTEGSDQEGIKNQYMSTVRSIKKEAKSCYADGILTNLSDDDFMDKMVTDTCFSLQIVLFCFGAKLEYPSEHLLFGSRLNERDLRMWMESMFIVGNQIPLVVLEQLMNQSFFRQAMERTTEWKKQPVGPMEKVLYEFLLVPASNNNQHGGPTLRTCLQRPIPKPCDLLHGLQLMVLGPRTEIDPNDIYDQREEVYISIGHQLPVDHHHIAINDAGFPSAKKLSQASIRFEGVDGMGSRGIHFKPKTFQGVLYLPCLEVDDSTEFMFQCLKAYEMTQQPREREVSSYLRFLSELVPTIEDAKILASHGVLKGQIHKLPGFFTGGLARDVGLGRKLHDVRLQVNDYSSSRYQKPKKSLKLCVKGAVVVQTVFTILQYYKNRDS